MYECKTLKEGQPKAEPAPVGLEVQASFRRIYSCTPRSFQQIWQNIVLDDAMTPQATKIQTK